jgi:hypothetical protein
MMNGLIIAAYGIVVTLASYLFFYFLGMMCLPQGIQLASPVSAPFSKKQVLSVFPAFWGVAFFCIICWFGIKEGFSFDSIFQSLALLAISLLIIRIKYVCCYIKTFLNARTLRKNLFWVSAYILFYGLTYVFLPLPNIEKYLPITRGGNIDIFNYILVTQNLISPSLDTHYFSSYYYQTPAVYYLHAWTSFFYKHNAMTAVMPILYSTLGAIGLLITFYTHYFFRCPKKIAVGIAAVVLCGSFYRYVIGVYFLSSLMGTVVWLGFLMEILKWDVKKTRFWHYSLVIFVYQSLLLLVYPVFFVFSFMIFCFSIGGLLFFSRHTFSWRFFIKKEVFFMGCISTSCLFLIALMPGYFEKCFSNLYEFAHRLGVIGFSLISPAAILGFPNFFAETPSSTYLPLIMIFVVCLSGLLYSIKVAHIDLSPAAYVLTFLAVGAFFAYFIYYEIEGSSRYQPWKFASYFVLPFAYWQARRDLNPQPAVLETAALPIELLA